MAIIQKCSSSITRLYVMLICATVCFLVLITLSSSSPTAPRVLKRTRRQSDLPCEQGEDLDDHVDYLFKLASRVVRSQEPFSGLIPNVTIEVPEVNAIIFLHQGGVTHVHTLARSRPAWVYCGNDSMSLGLTVKFQEVRITNKFRVIQDWKLLFDGAVEAQIKRPEVQVQFSQTIADEDAGEVSQQRIDALRIISLGNIRVMVKGLGNIGQAMSMYLTGFLRSNMDDIMAQIKAAEVQAVDFANQQLANLSIPIFQII